MSQKMATFKEVNLSLYLIIQLPLTFPSEKISRLYVKLNDVFKIRWINEEILERKVAAPV
jgi:hypothetical protein